MPALRDLTILLDQNPITDIGANSLATLTGSPSLRYLTVSLQAANLTAAGLMTLARASPSPAAPSLLRHYTIDTRENGVALPAAQQILATACPPQTPQRRVHILV
eukprot:TRINITY_DN5273_c0_g1_i1.p6 TRINITY_DN5273_c0_g1~~TRINITY_DN5273_c0_g1_i1.p6  ORF type:complete len:105 (+),score=37.96 TRINITY_DN5273_c0_g1_i1:1222-1536(+)